MRNNVFETVCLVTACIPVDSCLDVLSQKSCICMNCLKSIEFVQSAKVLNLDDLPKY